MIRCRSGEIYNSKNVTKVPYAILLTDGLSALAIKLDKSGNIKFRSKLLIDEEEEILCFCNRLDKYKLKYTEKPGNTIEDFTTRNEKKIRTFLLSDIETTYKKKDYEKLKYLYNELRNIASKSSSIGFGKPFEKLLDYVTNGAAEQHGVVINKKASKSSVLRKCFKRKKELSEND